MRRPGVDECGECGLPVTICICETGLRQDVAERRENLLNGMFKMNDDQLNDLIDQALKQNLIEPTDPSSEGHS